MHSHFSFTHKARRNINNNVYVTSVVDEIIRHPPKATYTQILSRMLLSFFFVFFSFIIFFLDFTKLAAAEDAEDEDIAGMTVSINFFPLFHTKLIN